jgi:ribosome maturation factor RimP
VKTSVTQLYDQIETTLAAELPEVELLIAERSSPRTVRVVIDRPGGTVDTGLCERVSRALSDVRNQYALEVSSPGIDRPLVRPEHFRRAVGSRIAVRTNDPIGNRRSFKGDLLVAGNDEIELDQDGETVRIPYAAIKRANLMAELHVGGTR